MRIPRIYQAGNFSVGDKIVLSAEAFQHVVKVLRLTFKDKFVLFDGQGSRFDAELIELTKKSCVASLSNPHFTDSLKQSLILVQAIIKPDKMDLIIQKAVELGVTQIIPLITDNCQLKLSQTLLNKKLKHWQRIMIAACEQCNEDHLPKLHSIQHLASLDLKQTGCLNILLDPYAKKSFNDINLNDKNIVLVVGPEGGLTTSEIKQLQQQANIIAVKLGDRILRAETAAIAGLTLCQWLYGKL